MSYLNHAVSQNELDARIHKTLANTFGLLGLMCGVTAVSSVFTLNWHPGAMGIIGLFVVSILVMFGIFANRDSGTGVLFALIFSGLQGLIMGPALAHYLHMASGPLIVASAAGLTATALAGCTMYVLVTRKTFSHLHSLLYAGLWVVIGAGLLNMFFHVPGMSLAIAAVSAVLFVMWMLYDLGQVISGAESNYIVAALQVYLDVLNLFLDLLRLLGSNSDD